MIKREDWFGLYGGNSWSKEMVGNAISHPAKMSHKLADYIYRHALEEGWISKGSLILDPFAGVAGTAFHALKNGLVWVGIELEPKFAKMSQENINAWNKRYKPFFPAWGEAYIFQGDSRQLVKILTNGDREAQAVVSSPPYSSSSLGHSGEPSEIDIQKSLFSRMEGAKYGDTDGNIGNMPDTQDGFEAAISSPPFLDNNVNIGAVGDTPAMRQQIHDSRPRDESYGSTDGQLGNMENEGFDIAVSSPPFLQTSGGTNVTSTEGVLADSALIKRHSAGNAAAEGYGNDENNLGNMPVSDDGFGLALSSPPYAELPVAKNHMTSSARADQSHPNYRPSWKKKFSEGFDNTEQDYGHTDGQLSDMRITDDGIELSVSSPPYADISQSGGTEGLKKYGTGLTGGEAHFAEYGESDEQLGRMKSTDEGYDAAISSPPYAEARIGQESGQEQCGHNDAYGDTEGQLGGMKGDNFEIASAVVSSPPFEAVTSDRPSASIVAGGLSMGASSMGDGYGETEGQLGNDSGNDFWIAARQIIDQTYAVLKPGGHAIWVCKKFVKGGKIVNFDRMWAKVCVAAGFEIVHWHRAWVIEQRGAQYNTDGNLIAKSVERKSFFRRLAEKKGSPRIDWETVICTRKPE